VELGHGMKISTEKFKEGHNRPLASAQLINPQKPMIMKRRASS